MTFLAALLRCRFGGTSWYLISFFIKYCFISAGHSFSSICIKGYSPLCFRYSCIFIINCSSSCSDFNVNASTKVALASWSYITMMHFAPLLGAFKSLPVWSKNLPLISIHYIVTLFCRTSSIDFVVISQEDVMDGALYASFSFVNCTFCLICRMWTFVVYFDFGRCFLTSCDVSPCHVA